MDIIFKFWFLLIFLLRPAVLCSLIGFFAGGVMTLKYPSVEAYMKKAEAIYDRVILPEVKQTKEAVIDVLQNENTDLNRPY